MGEGTGCAATQGWFSGTPPWMRMVTSFEVSQLLGTHMNPRNSRTGTAIPNQHFDNTSGSRWLGAEMLYKAEA